MKSHSVTIISALFFLSCLVVSCSRQTVVEPGLAYGTPCRPPCWRDLIPGQSTRQDAAQAMEQLRSDGWANRIDEGPTGCYIYPLSSTDGYIHVVISYDGIVTKIEGRTLFYYSVESLIEQFGNPEALLLVDKSDAICSSCENLSTISFDTPVMSSPVRLLYPTQGLQFGIAVPISMLGCICKEMYVSGFSYYPYSSMQELLDDINQERSDLYPDAGLPDITLGDLIEWHGFGGEY